MDSAAIEGFVMLSKRAASGMAVRLNMAIGGKRFSFTISRGLFQILCVNINSRAEVGNHFFKSINIAIPLGLFIDRRLKTVLNFRS